ncbi:hypothetical protein L7F22_058835 [Adiantum nelumboides]|nr:hypothetical protein [Adiantum nelumboides]
MRRRTAAASKGAKRLAKSPAPVTLARPDIRTLWILLLLSFLRTPTGAATPVPLRVAALSLGTDVLPSIFRGIDRDPPDVVIHIFRALHDGVLSQEAAVGLPRTRVVALFNEWTCKNLVTLYEREHQTVNVSTGPQGQIEKHTVADVAHHFLLALCTHPARGICYVDNGWYGKRQSEEDEAARAIDVDMQGRSESEQQGQGIHNKVLLGVLRSLAPSRSRKQGELAIRILAASPELFGPYLSASTGSFSSTSLEPRPDSISWLSTGTFLGRALSLPLPSFTSTLKKSDGTIQTSMKGAPPPFNNVVAGVMPSAISRNSLLRGITHKNDLTRQASLTLLARVLQRLADFKEVCLRAAEELGEQLNSNEARGEWLAREDAQDEEFDELDAIHSGPWTRCWRQVAREASLRLPEMSNIAEALESKPAVKKSDDDAGGDAEVQGSGILVSETGLRVAWLYHVVLPETGSSSSLDIGKLVTSELMQSKPVSTSDNDSGLDSVRWLCQLHALRLVAAAIDQGFSSFDLFARSSATSPTFLSQFLRLSITTSHRQVRQASRELVEKAMAKSVLFEHDRHEWVVWMEAFTASGQDDEGTASLVKFFDDCMQRCNKTPYRYIEMARRVGQDDGDQASDLLASPVLLTMVEQLGIQTKKNLVDESTQQEALTFFARLFPNLLTLGCSSVRLSALLGTLKGAFADTFALKVVHARTLFIGGKTSTDKDGRLSSKRSESFKDSKTYRELKDKLRTCARPLSPAELQNLAESVKELGALHLLDELHPHVEGDILRFLDGPLPPSLLAFYAPTWCATGNLDSIDWSDLSPTGALLFIEALKIVSIDGQQPASILELIGHAILRGHVRSADVRRVLLDDLFLGLCARRACLGAVVKLACDHLDPSDHEDVDAARRLADLAISNVGDKIEAARGIIAFLDATQRRQWLEKLLKAIQHRGVDDIEEEAAFASEIVSIEQGEVDRSSVAVGIILDNLSPLLEAAAQSGKNQASLLALVSLSLPTENQSVNSRDLEEEKLSRSVSSLVANIQDEHIVDTVVEQLLNVCSQLATGVLAAIVDVGRAGTLPRSCSRALEIVKVAGGSLTAMKENQMSALTSNCVRSLFSGVEGARPALQQAVKDLDEIMDQNSTVPSMLVELLPRVPGDAFKIDAIEVLYDLVAASSSTQSTNLELKLAVEAILERGLLWLVRRFAEDDEDSPLLVDSIVCFARLINEAAEKLAINPKRHLSEPVVTAAVKRRLSSAQHLRLVNALIRHADLEVNSLALHLGTILASSTFKMLRPTPEMSSSVKDVREQVAEILYRLVGRSTDLCRPATMASMVTIYGGSLSRSDRKLMDAMRIFELSTGQSSLSLWRSWNPQGQANREGTKGLDALLALDPLRVFATCTSFPRQRSFGGKRAGFTRPDGGIDGSMVYDPLFVLGLFSSTLASLGPMTGWQWVSVLRTNALGVVVCCLSSLSGENVQFLERGHVLLILDAARNIMGVSDGVPAYQPLTTTLFLAHALRCLAAPSTVLFPYTMHHLLQRPLFDGSDVPLLFNSIFSSTDHVRQERGWMLRFIRDVLQSGGSVEWAILRRRHVWDLIVSLYTTAPDRSTRSMIEDVVMAMARNEAAIFDVVLRGDLFGWIIQQLSLSSSAGAHRRIWLDLLEAATDTLEKISDGPKVSDKVIARALLALEQAADESLVLQEDDHGEASVAAASSTLRRLLGRLGGKPLAQVGVPSKTVSSLLDLLLRGCQAMQGRLKLGEEGNGKEEEAMDVWEDDDDEANKRRRQGALKAHRRLCRAISDVGEAATSIASPHSHAVNTAAQRLAVELGIRHARQIHIEGLVSSSS